MRAILKSFHRIEETFDRKAEAFAPSVSGFLGDVCGNAGDASFDGFTEHDGACDALPLSLGMVLDGS